MSWTYFPLVNNTLIEKEPFEECRVKLNLLREIFRSSIYPYVWPDIEWRFTIYQNNNFLNLASSSNPNLQGAIIKLRKGIDDILGVNCDVMWWWDSPTYIRKTRAQVLTAAIGETEWAAVTNKLITTDALTEIQQVIQYIAANAHVQKPFTYGNECKYSASEEQEGGILSETWTGYRVAATAGMQAWWDETVESPLYDTTDWAPPLSAEASAVGTYSEDPDPIYDDYCRSYEWPWCALIMRLSSITLTVSGYVDALNNESCTYRLFFHYDTPGYHFIPLPVLVDDVQVGSALPSGSPQSWTYELDHTDIDWETDTTKVSLNEIGATLWVPPLPPADADAWIVTYGTYYVADTVSHGSVGYQCILEHTATAATEPGVGVDWETYWEVVSDQGWATPPPLGPYPYDEYTQSSYSWQTLPFTGLMIQPYFTWV